MIPSKLDTSSPMVTGETPAEVRQKMAMDEVRNSLKSAEGDDAKLRKATQGFEAIFIGKLWEQMRKNVPKEGYLHSREEDTYMSMFDRELALKMSESGGIGLGQMLYDELKEQLSDKASGIRSRGIEAPEMVGDAGQGLPLKQEAEVRSQDDQHRAMALQQAELVLKNMSARRLGPAETGQTRLEPDFNPLADTDPTVRSAASSPPEIMNRALNLAARIEMGNARTEAASEVAKGNAQSRMLSQLNWPVQGDIVSGFGWQTDQASGERVWRSGVEISGAHGDAVQAGWGGTVVFAGERGDQGQTIVLEHPEGWRTVYGQVGKSLVSTGDTVNAGSKIAELEETGKESEPRLYFEIRKGEQAWNPEAVRERMQAVASGN
ncbi:peptidoglycan DD-metalloendopeptidase family protein [Desulfovibrio ferrophilus]|uniref:Peptidase M23 n=1 Tax=Desulfovibrio ferrophilus TaxID=241368 RepID=A0A2Z6AXD9_9BACT|nr:peptidoglycan DD-metalloendopeptidase family protein [Desulfovibrio ferrophilus]BBD07909.1 peptidase M23 [Desulfovibrio ferrophilus]